jgi:hypothetical protein
VAVRWFGETAISGFRSDSGAVTVDAIAPGAMSGRFTGQLRSSTEPGRLAVTGSFSGLSVEPAPRECAGRPGRAAPADSGEISDEELPPEPDPPAGDGEAGDRPG